MNINADEFIRTHTILTSPSLVPEVRLYLATEVTPLWQMTEDVFGLKELPPPFWAFAWPGGQGMARYLFDNPETVRGKRILDFAAGSGLAAITAMKIGATYAAAAEIDPLARTVIDMNAAQNQIIIDNIGEIDMTRPYKGVDLIIAGDVCYKQPMAAQMMKWLWLCVAKGTRVLLADPGRAYLPGEGLKECARYEVPTSRDLEDQDVRTAIVWEMQADFIS